MKIVIAGGTSEAEFIISMFKGKKNEIVVINPDKPVSSFLVKRCRVPVYTGEPWRKYVLEEANAYDANVFIALNPEDTDNYASCIMAKKLFNARKTICLVKNPKNVELYRKLGLDSVISSSYLLAQSIKGESTFTSLARSLSLDNGQVTVLEVVVLSKYNICNKRIMDIHFPKYASIAAIYRNYQLVIPNGLVELLPKDTLLLVTAPENEKKLLNYVQSEKKVLVDKKVETEIQPAEPPLDPPAPKKKSSKKGKK